MAKYRKKPVVVEAMQFVGDSDSYNKIREFAKGKIDLWEGRATNPQSLMVRTLEGNMIASCGDYIIRGVNGEFYPCKPDIFEKTYEIVE